MGPFDRWPTPGNGFEYFYGFLGGETDQYYPTLREGITRVDPWGTPEEGYHLTDDLTDRAIAWVRQQKALVPDKPFFMYFAPGLRTRPTTSRRSGRTSTKASSTMAGTLCASGRWRASRNSGSSRLTPS